MIISSSFIHLFRRKLMVSLAPWNDCLILSTLERAFICKIRWSMKTFSLFVFCFISLPLFLYLSCPSVWVIRVSLLPISVKLLAYLTASLLTPFWQQHPAPDHLRRIDNWCVFSLWACLFVLGWYLCTLIRSFYLFGSLMLSMISD